ncbi:MAG: SHOCT domain-containing protein [Bacteroidales bacterium]|nr:SHOCT domain-containing protein [Bacteroidales bacterium]
MKTKLSVLFVLLIAAVTFTQAQSKKDIEEDLTRCTITKDSIQNLLTGLSAKYDSINKACIAYDTMYNAVKEKVFLHDFDPANMSELIDSLRTGRDEAFSGITTTLNDSITLLEQENTKLKATIESMATGNDDDNTQLVNDLKQLKELLHAQIITQEEFDAKKTVLLEKF